MTLQSWFMTRHFKQEFKQKSGRRKQTFTIAFTWYLIVIVKVLLLEGSVGAYVPIQF